MKMLEHVVFLYISFSNKPSHYFPQWLHQYIFSPTVYVYSLYLISSAIVVICIIFNDIHSNRWEVISHCAFDLHFSNKQWYWESFHVPISHVHLLFGKMSIQFFCLFLNRLFVCFWCWVLWTLYIFWLL